MNRNKNNLPIVNKDEEEVENFFEWKYHCDKDSGELVFDSVQLSGENALDADAFKKALKQASGTSNPKIGERILKKIANGLSPEEFEQRINEASILLPSLNPKNPTEALILGQFLALQDSGMKCLNLANSQETLFQVEKFFNLAVKLFNTANQTMQAFTKFRSGGQQTVQVLHVHNEGQAIVAQNLSAKTSKGESRKKV